MSDLVGPWFATDAAPAALAEGARQWGTECLYVDLLDGRGYRMDPRSGETRTVLSLDMPVGALAPIAGSDTSIAAAGTGVWLTSPDGRATHLTDLEGRAPVAMRVNDARADPRGHFWVGTMAYDPDTSSGRLYRIDHDFTATCVMDDIRIPNGPVFSADGASMYIADSAAGIIYVCRIDEAGAVVDRVEFARVDGNPDGMAMDSDGCLWSAVWGGSRLHRYAPSGELIAQVPVPCSQPTSVALVAGWMVVTSAAIGLDEPTRNDGKVFRAPTAVHGVPTERFVAGCPPVADATPGSATADR